MNMISQFEVLNAEEKALLLNAPVLIAVYAVNYESGISEKGKLDAIKLAHLRTFTSDAVLKPFYNEIENTFQEKFEAELLCYTPFNEANSKKLANELNNIKLITSKLEPIYGNTLFESLVKFGEHIRKADRELLENFIFPFPLPGLTD